MRIRLLIVVLGLLTVGTCDGMIGYQLSYPQTVTVTLKTPPPTAPLPFTPH